MLHYLSYTFAFVYFVQSIAPRNKGCSISTSDLDEIHPLILNSQFDFLYPNNEDEILLEKNEKLIISCGDEHNWLHNENSLFINITCIRDDKFRANKKEIAFEKIQCMQAPIHSARYTSKKCSGDYEQIVIGFEVGAIFVRQIDICFDPKVQTTLYAHFKMTKHIMNSKSSARVAWISDSFYNFDKRSADQLYTKKSQRKEINSLLELSTNSKAVVQDNDFYLARGHLAAKADFFYGNQQQATFHLVNAAPQWQSFNNGNWKYLEMNVRDFAHTRGLDLDIYTGTYEVSSMKNKQSKNVNLYLFTDEKDVGLPVPQFFWKIIYDSESSAGVVFVGVNNPYIQRSDVPELIICDDVSEQISWINLNNKDLTKGYTYACDVNTFSRVVRYAPNLRAKSLLK